MDDEKLIAAAAKKAGWTNVHESGGDYYGDHCGERFLLPNWRTSVDACLELLDKEKQFEITWLSRQQRWRVYYEGLIPMAYHNSLPRAILLAWLEA